MYKKQRNSCTLLRWKSIANYFHQKADQCSSKPKDFLKFFGSLFHSKKGQANDIVLQQNNDFITDKSTIAKLCNEYFISICDNFPLPSKDIYGSDFSSHPSILTINSFMSTI